MLKSAITRFIEAIQTDMCKRVIGGFAVRLNECLNCRGGHIEYVLRVINVLKTEM